MTTFGWCEAPTADPLAELSRQYYCISSVIQSRDPLKPNPSSGVPIYLQLMEQVKHAIETGALRPGEQLPGIRPLAEELVDQSQHRGEGVSRARARRRDRAASGRRRIRLGQGADQEGRRKLRAAQATVATAIEKLRARGVTDEEIRRLVEAELAGVYRSGGSAKAQRSKRDERSPGDRNGGPPEALRRGRSAARARSAGAGGIDLRLPRPERRRQDDDDQGAARHGAADAGEARVFGLSPADSGDGVEIRRRAAFVSDEKDLYDYLTVGEMIAFTRPFFPNGAPISSRSTCASSSCRRAQRQGAVARHAHQAGVAARALPRRRAAAARRADLGPGSGHGGRRAAGARRPRRPTRRDGVLLLAPARRSRADRRPRGDHRSRANRRGRRARRSALALPAHPARVRVQAPEIRSARRGRIACAARAASSRCSPTAGAAVVEEARAFRPASIDVVARDVEGDFPRIGTKDGGLTCCGTKRGSKRGGASSPRW